MVSVVTQTLTLVQKKETINKYFNGQRALHFHTGKTSAKRMRVKPCIEKDHIAIKRKSAFKDTKVKNHILP